MLKYVVMTLLTTFGLSTFTGCVVYPHHHHDDVVVEPAGYRYHDHDRDHDHWDDHHRDHDWDHDRGW